MTAEIRPRASQPGYLAASAMMTAILPGPASMGKATGTIAGDCAGRGIHVSGRWPIATSTPPPAGQRLAAFQFPNYRLYWAGQLATNVGSWMQIVATGWLVLELTDSPAYLGLNGAFLAVPILV